MLNAPGQGAIAVETRNEGAVKDIVLSLDHENTRNCVYHERLFLKTLMGDVHLLLRILQIENNIITLKGTILSMNGTESITKELKIEYNSNVNIGIDLANLILNSVETKFCRNSIIITIIMSYNVILTNDGETDDLFIK